MAKKIKRDSNYGTLLSKIIKKREQAGIHLLVDFWYGKEINNEKRLEEILQKAAEKSRSVALKTSIHKFNPHGITGIILLAESHIAIHTWPEINYIGIDIFTCGEKTRPYEALKVLQKSFKPKKITIKEVKRGVRD